MPILALLPTPKTWPNTDHVTQPIETLSEIAGDYDAIVLDQWGVLHDGATPYAGAVACLEGLAGAGHRLAVLSNSGKRSAPNALRIAQMGFAPSLFAEVMTSGEALWRDAASGNITAKRLFPIEREAGDAVAWAKGLDVSLCKDVDEAEAVLLMGVPDGATLADWQGVLDQARSRDLPVYCSNPDRASPRPGGLVVSPGTLAFAYQDMGGAVTFYGKPHRPVFDALSHALGSSRLLMVGDSLEHDIAGAQSAGWDSLLIEGGLYARDFASGPAEDVLDRLVAEKRCQPPTYRLKVLS